MSYVENDLSRGSSAHEASEPIAFPDALLRLGAQAGSRRVREGGSNRFAGLSLWSVVDVAIAPQASHGVLPAGLRHGALLMPTEAARRAHSELGEDQELVPFPFASSAQREVRFSATHALTRWNLSAGDSSR